MLEQCKAHRGWGQGERVQEEGVTQAARASGARGCRSLQAA